MRASKLKMLLLGSAAFAAAGPLGVSLAQEVGESEADRSLDKIVVVGSRIGSATAESDTTSLPVQYITRDQFDYTPAESIADFTRRLPVNTGSIYSKLNAELDGGQSYVKRP
ncbi:MAG: hypothetical protein AAGF53_19700, partial [Pseudomonadota bacterium]